MKRIEVSAICSGFAISPDGDHLFMFISPLGLWRECEVINTMSMWGVICKDRLVHRGIFTIKVAVD